MWSESQLAIEESLFKFETRLSRPHSPGAIIKVERRELNILHRDCI